MELMRTCLKKRGLRFDAIDDEGVEIMVQGLTNNNHLRDLSLSRNAIGDAGVDGLINSLATCHLEKLYLAGNDSISTEGFETLLSTTCNLEHVSMGSDNVEYEWENIFSSLANNRKLTSLAFSSDFEILPEDWAALSKVLCDTSTINSTHLSNHTLQSLGDGITLETEHDDVEILLAMNEYADKKQVAIMKILEHHSYFDMQPLFEWDFKALPHVINWFSLASDCSGFDKEDIKSRKLSSIYQFILGMPMLYIEEQVRTKLKKNEA